MYTKRIDPSVFSIDKPAVRSYSNKNSGGAVIMAARNETSG